MVGLQMASIQQVQQLALVPIKNISRTWNPQLLDAAQGSKGEVGGMENERRKQKLIIAVVQGAEVMRKRAGKN